jgi:WhiB family transcriptional regulator, redox-sensing transcriptional regulator
MTTPGRTAATKTCTDCARTLPVDSFSGHPSTVDRKRSMCKKCCHAADQRRRGATRLCAGCARDLPLSEFRTSQPRVSSSHCHACRMAHAAVWARRAEEREARRYRAEAARKVDAAADWRRRSACHDEDPELFFPVGTTGPALLQIEEAKSVCRSCPVMAQCQTWALESGQDAGVWGGMSEDERRALKRREARDRTRLRNASLT